MSKKQPPHIPHPTVVSPEPVIDNVPQSKFRRPYEHHGCAGHTCSGDSLTEQHHVTECDINSIVKRYAGSSALFQTPDPSLYIDLPPDVDYQSALATVLDAETKFAAVPAEIRNRFDNNPAAFLGFMSDPKNYDAIADLGLLPKRPPPETPPSPQTPQNPPNPPAPNPPNQGIDNPPNAPNTANGG